MKLKTVEEVQQSIKNLLYKAQEKNWKNGGVSVYDLADLQEASDRVITQDRHSLHTSLVEAVVGLEYSEDDIDGNHSYDRARQNEGFKYAQEEVLIIINSIFKE